MLSGRGHCGGPITLPEDSYRVIWILNLIDEPHMRPPTRVLSHEKKNLTQ